jgi:catechol 2,3-dioxygenase-like lactoylglutathione lyase family enzyme
MKLSLTAVFTKDIEKSKNFYVNALGQTVDLDNGVHVSFRSGFSLWDENSASSVIFGKECETRSGNGFELCFETEELEKAFAQADEYGAEIISPITEQPWGQRVFRVFDPDGHIVEVAEPLAMSVSNLIKGGMTAGQVSQKTTIPLEVVKAMAGLR